MSMLDSTDALVLLPDWVESDGASIERDMARYTGKPIYILDEDGAHEPEKEKAATGEGTPMTANPRCKEKNDIQLLYQKGSAKKSE